MRIRRLVMLRHGQTDFNLDSRMQGQLDSALTDLGRAQAVAAAEVLGKLQPLLIVVVGLASRLRHGAQARGSEPGCRSGGRAVARDPPGRLARPDPHPDRCGAPGARLAWREDATWAPHGGESRVDVAARSVPLVAEMVSGEPEWGGRRRAGSPGGAGGPRWPDRRVVGRAAEAAGRQLAGSGWHGQLQLVQLSGHTDDRADQTSTASAGAWMCGTLRRRCPTMSSESRRAHAADFRRLVGLLRAHRRFARRRPPHLAQYCCSQLGWDVELIGRIGWTCRDVWWAATQDPRSWAALPRAGAVIFATSGMDSLPSVLPTALRS